MAQHNVTDLLSGEPRVPWKKLRDGRKMPVLGLGTYNIASTESAVLWALQAGYRLIDTASLYWYALHTSQSSDTLFMLLY